MKRTVYSTFLFLLFVMAASGIKAHERQDICTGWMFRQVNIGEWLPASVPGTVHTDLLANGKIPEPFYSMNEKELQWIDKLDWEYRTVFDAGDFAAMSHVDVVFDGLDTYAEVYLNGKLILKNDNMFVGHRVDVSSILSPHDNELRIIFKSPVVEGLQLRSEYGIQLSANQDNSSIGGLGDAVTAPYNRKAQYHWGWDWGPRFVTSGIWRPVYLDGWNEARLSDHYLRTAGIGNGKASMEAEIGVEADSPGEYEVEIFMDDKKMAEDKICLHAGNNVIREDFIVKSPKLWYPNGQGQAYLYDVKIVLKKDGIAIDTDTMKTGIRTVSLVHREDPDGRGCGFAFEVNGNELFAKGANWIPADSFLPDITYARMESLLSDAVEANMNMIRVWGGGIYEDDRFYDICDSLGILVWQDFAFACSNLPGNEEFLENVKKEAEYNVVRLRNHPSLALFCGNNEIESMWKPWNGVMQKGMKGKYSESEIKILDKAYKDIFHSILPEAVKKYASSTSYWHSTPSPGEGVVWGSVPSTDYGDVHNWQNWHGSKPFEYFDYVPSRFVSEFGFQSFPELATVKSYAEDEDHDIYSPVMSAHQRGKGGNERIKYYIDLYYHMPDDFEDMLYLSQIMQADGVCYGIRSYRRNMPWCMGALYWQLNDCWPVASWSSIDYYGRKKALHYAVEKAFENVLVSPYLHNDTLDLYVVSDLRKDVVGTMDLILMDFDGNILKKKSFSSKARAFSSELVRTMDINGILSGIDRKNVVLKCSFTYKDGMSEVLQYFDYVKNLELSKPEITFDVADAGDNRLAVTVVSDRLAKNIAIYLDGEAGKFSDNYFDLLPNERRTIEIETELSAEEALEHLTYRSVADTY